MSQTVSIIVSLLILSAAFFAVIWVFTALYFKIAKERISEKKDIEISVWLTVTSLSALFVSLVFLANNGLFIYLLSSFVLMAIPAVFILKKIWKFQMMDAVILAFSLGVILNPYWLTLMGLI